MVDEPSEPVLALADRVLLDLALPDGMFVGRRPGTGAPGEVVIQSGEEGRYVLTLPDPGSAASLEAFVSRIQAHVSELYGQPVPACPVHPHGLECRAVADALMWVCPNGEWCSPIGEYDARNWPPADLGDESVPDRVFSRIVRHEIDEVRELVPDRREGAWVVRVGVWPMSDALTERLREVAAPVPVEVYAQPGRWYRA